MIEVKNNGAEDFSARFAGVMYIFRAGETNTVTRECAEHIFGLGKSNKQAIMAMHGKLTHSSQIDTATAWLNSFSFRRTTDPEPDFVDITQDDEPIVEPEVEPAPEAPNNEVPPDAGGDLEQEQESALLLTGSDAEAGSDGLAEASPTATEETENNAPELSGTLRLPPRKEE